jgi:hypothetical protein
LGAKGVWKGGADGLSPAAEDEVMKSYLAGEFATERAARGGPPSFE